MTIRVLVLGLRGLPDVEGGIERHAEHLYPLLVERGCAVEVLVRSPYHPKEKSRLHRGVALKRLWSPAAGVFETILHSFLGTLYAGCVARPDLLHVHAIGPALVVPLARLFGLRVVVTHHGADYEREKWSAAARAVLKLGERFGMRQATARIAISRTIQALIWRRHARNSALIANGVNIPDLPHSTDALDQLGLTPCRYVIHVGRFVPEKRHLDLIRAFRLAGLAGWKLALVGRTDRPDDYVRAIMAEVGDAGDVVLTGFRQGLALKELFGHAGVFVLPSSHEGLPIALLEALSFGLPAIASDIPANLEVGLPQESYFPVGDVQALAARIVEAAVTVPESERSMRTESVRAWVRERFDWHTIADQTLRVYQDAVNLSARHVGHAANP